MRGGAKKQKRFSDIGIGKRVGSKLRYRRGREMPPEEKRDGGGRHAGRGDASHPPAVSRRMKGGGRIRYAYLSAF